MNDIKDYFEEVSTQKFNIEYSLVIIYSLMGIIFFSTQKNEIIYVIEGGIPLIVTTFIVALLLSLLALYFDRKKVMMQGIRISKNIFSLERSAGQKGFIQGVFVLGTGSISGEINTVDYYTYYVKGRFGYVLERKEALDIEVVERNDIEPSYKEVYVNKRLMKFLFVPKGTIKKAMKL